MILPGLRGDLGASKRLFFPPLSLIQSYPCILHWKLGKVKPGSEGSPGWLCRE